MQEEKTLGRREFTVASALAALSGVAITVSGCGGSSSSSNPMTPSTPAPAPTPTPAPPEGDVVGTISANHGHRAEISAARLADPAMVELDITGDADHPHTVALSADEVQQIAGGGRVAKTSTTDQSHNHTVTFN